MRFLISFAGLTLSSACWGCAPLVSLSLSATHTAWNIAAEVPRAAISCLPWSSSGVEKPDSPPLPGAIEPKRGRLFPVPVAPVFAPTLAWHAPEARFQEPGTPSLEPAVETYDVPPIPPLEPTLPINGADSSAPSAMKSATTAEWGPAGLPWEDSPREVVRAAAELAY